MIDERRVQEAVDRSEIVNLIAKSIISRDSGRWEELAECYHSQAEFSSSWWTGKPSDFIKAASTKLKAAQDEGGEQKHLTGSTWIVVKGDRATAECDLILFMRTKLRGTALDFATWSRRLHLLAREDGEWKIWRRFAIYEKDRVDPVDPTVDLSSLLDQAALAKYPAPIKHHVWRNDLKGSKASHNLCIRGTPEERAVREEARQWMES